MVYGADVKPGEIDEVVSKLCGLYPNIPREDHMLIVEVAYDNYFGKEGLFSWYERTADKLTPDVLAEIRKDMHDFFFAESHLIREGVYTPLSER